MAGSDEPEDKRGKRKIEGQNAEHGLEETDAIEPVLLVDRAAATPDGGLNRHVSLAPLAEAGTDRKGSGLSYLHYKQNERTNRSNYQQ